MNEAAGKDDHSKKKKVGDGKLACLIIQHGK
jgi:hypothetical protein